MINVYFLSKHIKLLKNEEHSSLMHYTLLKPDSLLIIR